MLYRLAVHFDLLDTLWMQIGIQLFYHTFYHDDKSGYLDTTTGTACTCTNEHQNNQYRPTCLVPQVKIHTGESGCCYDRSDLERCMTEYCPESIHCMNQIQYKNYDRCHNNEEIGSHLLHLQCLFDIAK